MTSWKSLRHEWLGWRPMSTFVGGLILTLMFELNVFVQTRSFRRVDVDVDANEIIYWSKYFVTPIGSCILNNWCVNWLKTFKRVIFSSHKHGQKFVRNWGTLLPSWMSWKHKFGRKNKFSKTKQNKTKLIL